MDKSADAFRTISEVAGELDLPRHVLRFWETRFPQIKPLKRAGGRRYYRPRDIDVLRAIKHLLYGQGYTIKGVQRVLKEQGAGALAAARDAANDSRPELSFRRRGTCSHSRARRPGKARLGTARSIPADCNRRPNRAPARIETVPPG
jgi:DNA-binding transcriptional MerR regulator